MVKRVVLVGVVLLAMGACAGDEPTETASIGAVEDQLPRAETTTTSSSTSTTAAPLETAVPTTAAAAPPTTAATMPPTTRATAAPRVVAAAPTTVASVAPVTPVGVTYANCDAVRAAGAAPIRLGEPGYSKQLDRDGDGIACET